MEIKVNCNLARSEKDGGETKLFEGNDIVHGFKYCENIEEFQKKHITITDGYSAWNVGIPDEYWTDDKEKQELINKTNGNNFYFLLITFTDTMGSYRYLIIKNSTVFITAHGQTVDRINVD